MRALDELIAYQLYEWTISKADPLASVQLSWVKMQDVEKSHQAEQLWTSDSQNCEQTFQYSLLGNN